MSINQNKEFKPLIVAFCCNWCSYAGADLAGTSRLQYPAEVKIIKVPCSCRVNPLFVLRAFQRGADGVIICGCHPGDCHYSTGNYYTRRRITLLYSMLDFIGIERGRTRLEWVSAAEGAKFAKTMNSFVEEVHSLGVNTRLSDFRVKDTNFGEFEKLVEEYSHELEADINTEIHETTQSGQILEKMKVRAKELMESGEVSRILGWNKGDFEENPEPAFFNTPQELDNLVYNKFCSANLSRYMIETSKWDGKTLVFLKPCDTYSYNQLVKENLINPSKSFVIGVGCEGNVAIDEMEETGLLEKCLVCTKSEHMVFDELIGEDVRPRTTTDRDKRFKGVAELENLTPEERYNFWQSELSKCIRCNACRNACPSCNCKKCVFDNNNYDTAQKANATTFEEQMFHIIRSYHVAGRCTDCGECTRVCPQDIKLHLLNRKFIKDINELYGEFQAGEDIETVGPLTRYDIENDAEPSIVHERGQKQ